MIIIDLVQKDASRKNTRKVEHWRDSNVAVGGIGKLT